MNQDQNGNLSGRRALFAGTRGDGPGIEKMPVSEILDTITQICGYKQGDEAPVLVSPLFKPILDLIAENARQIHDCTGLSAELQDTLSQKEKEISDIRADNTILSSERESYLNELINSHTEFDRALEIFQYHEVPMVLTGPNKSIHDANDAFCTLFSIARSEITRINPPLTNYLPDEPIISGPDEQRYKVIVLTPPIIPFDHEAISLLILIRLETPMKKPDLQDPRIIAFNLLPLPAAIINQYQTITICNNAFCNMLGRPRELVELRDIGSVGITFDNSDCISGVLSDGTARQCTAVITHPDTEELPAYLEIYNISDTEENTAVLVVGDITSEETESTDGKNEDLMLRMLLDLNPSAAALIDENAKVIFSNEGFSELTGLSPRDLTGIDVRDLGIFVPDEPLIQGATEAVFMPEIIRMRSAWGENELSGMVVPVSSFAKEVTAILILQPFVHESVTKDMQEEKKVEQPLQSPDQGIESIPIPSLTVDFSGNIIRVNEAFLSLAGSDSGTFVGKHRDHFLTVAPSGFVQANLPSGILTFREVVTDYGDDISQRLSWFIDLSHETDTINKLTAQITSLESELNQARENAKATSTELISTKQTIYEQIDIVEFELNEERYAIDITMVREVVEMLPITPLPKTPPYVIGIINLRGEVTHIIDLAILLGQRARKDRSGQKIIIIPSDVTNGEHVGIIVDNVQSVTEVQGRQVSLLGDDITDQIQTHIKGIIKITHDDILERHAEVKDQVTLVIWLDIQRILHDIQV